MSCSLINKSLAIYTIAVYRTWVRKAQLLHANHYATADCTCWSHLLIAAVGIKIIYKLLQVN